MDEEMRQVLEERMAALPQGGITYKTIFGKRYAYYQWTENGKQRARRVQDGELDELQRQIAERKRLKEQLHQQRAFGDLVPAECATVSRSLDEQLLLSARLGEELRAFAKPVAAWKRRQCFDDLERYLRGESDGRVFVLYGLRRTGKTTLIRQALAAMDDDDMGRAAFLQVSDGDSLASVNHDLKTLEAAGVRFAFIDEVTLADDFIEGAALLSDIYATSGMKIVLSGTDSLGFLLAEDEELYDRCILAHTTHIPYREFSEVLGLSGIDAYIEHGGTMSVSGVNYNATGRVFADARHAGEYVDSAIARNIQHSLRNYQDGRHFRGLLDLYESDELTNVINRVVEGINHRFTLEVLSRDFRSHDLGIARANLRKNREHPQDVLDRIDLEAVTDRLKQLLEIKDAHEREVNLTQRHGAEIEEYLRLLDVISSVDTVNAADLTSRMRTAVSQPGLRYAQAKALVQSLVEDAALADLDVVERRYVTERILEEVRGRMMEDIVLLETKLARPECEVFALHFAVGEFDMVVADPETLTCEIYEIKHSTQRVAAQRRHLLDPEKRAFVEHRWGAIAVTAVMYRGEEAEEEGVTYLNVEAYLEGLGKE